RLVIAGLLLIAVGIAGAAVVLAPTVPVALALVAWGVAGLGMGIAFSTISLAVLESAPPGHEGTASASMQLTNVLGVALGTGVGGVIIGYASAQNGTPHTGIMSQDLLMIGVAGLAMVVAMRLPGRREPAPEPAPGRTAAASEAGSAART
ncbi:MAG TPA: MFS transporter, partial [Roseiflexaceae bacterium]